MNMKFFIFLIALIYFNNISSNTQVVNSCGKKGTEQPTSENDCKDAEEPACKMVTVALDGQSETKRFCAIIHGKYNDEQVLLEVGKLIHGNVTVTGNGFMINLNCIFILFFTILMFL